jgi:hypothetical protein
MSFFCQECSVNKVLPLADRGRRKKRDPVEAPEAMTNGSSSCFRVGRVTAASTASDAAASPQTKVALRIMFLDIFSLALIIFSPTEFSSGKRNPHSLSCNLLQMLQSPRELTLEESMTIEWQSDCTATYENPSRKAT